MIFPARHLFCILAALAVFSPLHVSLAQKVDLALVLLIDDSGSIDDAESQMQLQGYAAAFRDRDVIASMTRGPNKSIAVSTVMFTDRVQVMIPWMRLDGLQSATEFAARMERLPRVPGAATHIGKAVEFSINHLSHCPYEYFASTIDVSADGWDNEFISVANTSSFVVGVLGAIAGIPVNIPDIPDPVAAQRLSQIKNYATSRGITINAIAIEDPSLNHYFSSNLIAGPSSFTMFAPNFRSFTNSIKEKLLREIKEALKISSERQERTEKLYRSQNIKSPAPSPSSVTHQTTKTNQKNSQSNNRQFVPENSNSPLNQPILTPDIQDTMPPSLAVSDQIPFEFRVSLMVRDATNCFPLNNVLIEPVGDTKILFQHPVEGHPGLIQLIIAKPEASPPRVRVSAQLHSSKDIFLQNGNNEVKLERIPLRIIW